MTTVSDTTLLQQGTVYTNERVAGQGDSNGRTFSIPAAHSGDDARLCGVVAGGVLLAIIVFVVSAVLWGVGASQGSTGMLIAGQVLTGIQIASYGLLAVIGCCAWSCLGKCPGA